MAELEPGEFDGTRLNRLGEIFEENSWARRCAAALMTLAALLLVLACAGVATRLGLWNAHDIWAAVDEWPEGHSAATVQYTGTWCASAPAIWGMGLGAASRLIHFLGAAGGWVLDR